MSRIAAIGGITIDAVATADGSTPASLLGGNAVYGAWAASLWLDSAAACLVGCVGEDFPTSGYGASGRRDRHDGGTLVPGRATPVWRMAYRTATTASTSVRTSPVTAPSTCGARRRRHAGALEAPARGREPVLARIEGVHCGPVQPEVLLHNLAALQGRDLTVLVDPGEESAAWDPTPAPRCWPAPTSYCPSLDDLEHRRGARRERTPATWPPTWPAGAREPSSSSSGRGARSCAATATTRHIAALRRPPSIPPAPATATAVRSWRRSCASTTLRGRRVATATASLVVEQRGLLACLAIGRDRPRPGPRGRPPRRHHLPPTTVTIGEPRMPDQLLTDGRPPRRRGRRLDVRQTIRQQADIVALAVDASCPGSAPCSTASPPRTSIACT